LSKKGKKGGRKGARRNQTFLYSFKGRKLEHLSTFAGRGEGKKKPPTLFSSEGKKLHLYRGERGSSNTIGKGRGYQASMSIKKRRRIMNAINLRHLREADLGGRKKEINPVSLFSGRGEKKGR